MTSALATCDITWSNQRSHLGPRKVSEPGYVDVSLSTFTLDF